MDTIAMHTLLTPHAWEALAAQMTRHLREGPGGGRSRQKAAAALRLSRLTLYSGSPVVGLPAHRVVCEFSVAKALSGPSLLNAGALGAAIARDLVLDEVEARYGLQLHGHEWTVCRLDVARTFLVPAAPYVREAAAWRLSRRETKAYETGTTFYSKHRHEVLYDKAAELRAAASKARSRDGDPLDEQTGFAEALELVPDGALRVEVRLRKGSAFIKRSLGVPDALWASVVTDENAFRLIAGFLAHIDLSSIRPPLCLAECLLSLGLGPDRVLQLLGMNVLIAEAHERSPWKVLRLKRREWTALADEWQQQLAQVPALPPLSLSMADFERTRQEEEERRWHVWQQRRKAWRAWLSLPEREPEPLAA